MHLSMADLIDCATGILQALGHCLRVGQFCLREEIIDLKSKTVSGTCSDFNWIPT